MSYCNFDPVAPDKTQVLEAANLHRLCDPERRAELSGLVEKGF